MALSYRIADDPVPSRLERLALNPMWLLLSFMLAGAWIAWPWFAFNGFALGSPTRRRELAVAIGGLVGAVAIVFVILLLSKNGVVEGRVDVRLALLFLTAFKIATAYILYTLQTRPFAIFEHYHPDLKTGAMPVVVAFIVAPRLLDLLPKAPLYNLLRLVLQ